MDRIVIRGGRPLHGTIPISGAKNAALPLMAASLLSEAPLTLTNVPRLADVGFLVTILEHLGVEAVFANGTLTLDAARVRETTAPYDLVRKMRASFLVLGPLLARFGRARVSLPGGCAIGARPVDLHLKAMEALGAAIEIDEGYVVARAPKGLKGGRIAMPFVSVGATENALIAAALAEGESVIENAAREPEIADLAACLRAMGVAIEGTGTKTLHVTGATRLEAATHRVLPDRIETGTFAMAVAMAGGEVTLSGTDGALIGSVIALLRDVGVTVETEGETIRIARGGARVRGADVATEPFPGFPTDLQAQFMALMTMADGRSTVRETIFENRFMHVPELTRLGARIEIAHDRAHVTGVAQLKGAPVMATDLRASVSLVIAALGASGETTVSRVYHLDRGFERLEEKLSACGADIARTGEPGE